MEKFQATIAFQGYLSWSEGPRTLYPSLTSHWMWDIWKGQNALGHELGTSAEASVGNGCKTS